LKETDPLESLPPLRAVIAAHGLSARKSLGQNFLLDLNLTRRIARAGGPLAGCHIVEVGPGPGGLTRALLLEGAEHLTAIERDPRAIPAVHEIAVAASRRLSVIAGDALTFDYNAVGGPLPVRIVANLPYNIATPLLTKWLSMEPWPPVWLSLTLMLQREVAERIVAVPRTKSYGRLAILSQWRTRPKILFDVAARAFTPPPKVTSSIVRFEPIADPAPVAVSAVESVTAAAFGQRRKMLRSSLRALWQEPEPVLNELGIAPTQRAEDLAIEQFLSLAGRVSTSRRKSR
jgi:16S rRNA (adenine1518-N6/adenine1519-N6)-dimethyltransferase